MTKNLPGTWGFGITSSTISWSKPSASIWSASLSAAALKENINKVVK